ncbi:MAG: hypothetical protein HQL20_08575 [Candidatus Omnitrophica bacterium]|nr:hypothetical protein [Candidatus Omnitrophota bacterium]
MRRMHFTRIVVFFFCVWSAASLAAAADDSFPTGQKLESAHFLIYSDPQVDLTALFQSLDVGLGEALLVNEPGIKGDNLPVVLDALYSRIAATLDMNLYSLRCMLKICRNDAHLKSVARVVLDREVEAPSFYVYEMNTIYISAEHFTKEVLGHEIAHAIISHYFVVQPPAKVAEILSGYVEYELRKLSRQP